MILSQLAPHRLAAQPNPRRSLRLPEEGEEGAGGDDGAGSMKEVASLQVCGVVGVFLSLHTLHFAPTLTQTPANTKNKP